MNYCRLCDDPVYEGLDVHPCCVWWIEEQGSRRCVACLEAKRLRREHHRRQHTKPPRPDPRCEFCTGEPIPDPHDSVQDRPGSPASTLARGSDLTLFQERLRALREARR